MWNNRAQKCAVGCPLELLFHVLAAKGPLATGRREQVEAERTRHTLPHREAMSHGSTQCVLAFQALGELGSHHEQIARRRIADGETRDIFLFAGLTSVTQKREGRFGVGHPACLTSDFFVQGPRVARTEPEAPKNT